VFQSDGNNLFSGSAEIYVMNADGSGQTRLTSDAADDSAPVWSPDGTKIAFQSAMGVNYQVYVMNVDGSGQVNISNNSSNEKQPSWSPDGTKLAFAARVILRTCAVKKSQLGAESSVWPMNSIC
jgi:Tol biopolymer transport system component